MAAFIWNHLVVCHCLCIFSEEHLVEIKLGTRAVKSVEKKFQFPLQPLHLTPEIYLI